MTPVVFDLDGTLIDSLPDVTEAANALLADEGLDSIPQSTVAGFVGLGEQVFLDRLIAASGLDPVDYERLMERFIIHYKVATRNTRLFPGVRDALDRLRSDGVPLALCTNKPDAPLRSTLEAGGLVGVFDVVVAGDTLPSRKPDPAPLWYIMEKLSAETCVYVGDSEVDAETASRAGVPFVFFTEGIRRSPASEIAHKVAFSDFGALREIYHSLKV